MVTGDPRVLVDIWAVINDMPCSLVDISISRAQVELVKAEAPRARTNDEERGVHTLRLGCGMATWVSDRSQSTPNAPILLGSLEMRHVASSEGVEFDQAPAVDQFRGI